MPRRILVVLTFLAGLLPIVTVVAEVVGRMLEKMGDAGAGRVLHYFALFALVLWIVQMIVLVLALAVGQMTGPNEPPEE